jgi:hypothetical protein
MRIDKQELYIKIWEFLKASNFEKIDDDDYCFFSKNKKWLIVVDDYIWISERVVNNWFILQHGELNFLKFKGLFNSLNFN